MGTTVTAPEACRPPLQMAKHTWRASGPADRPSFTGALRGGGAVAAEDAYWPGPALPAGTARGPYMTKRAPENACKGHKATRTCSHHPDNKHVKCTRHPLIIQIRYGSMSERGKNPKPDKEGLGETRIPRGGASRPRPRQRPRNGHGGRSSPGRDFGCPGGSKRQEWAFSAFLWLVCLWQEMTYGGHT